MARIVLILFLTMCAAGIALALVAPLPVVVIIVALVVILLGAAAFGLEAIQHSRASGDNWFVAVGRGIWVATEAAFEFLF